MVFCRYRCVHTQTKHLNLFTTRSAYIDQMRILLKEIVREIFEIRDIDIKYPITIPNSWERALSNVLSCVFIRKVFFYFFTKRGLQFVPTPIHPSPHQHPIFIHPHQLIQPQIITQFHQIPATPHRQVPHFPHFNGATRCFLTLAIVEITKRNRERSVI